MKKLLVLAVLFTVVTSKSNAMSIDSDSIKAYGIPCAITIGAGAALIKNNGIEIGTATCLAISASTYINSPVKKAKELDEKISDFQTDFWNKLKVSHQKNKDDISYFKDQIRKVIAKKVIESQLKIDERVVEYLNSKEFKISVRNEMMKVLDDHYPAIDKVIKRSIQKNMGKMVVEVTKKVTSNILNTTYAKVDKESFNSEEEPETQATQLDSKKQKQVEPKKEEPYSSNIEKEMQE